MDNIDIYVNIPLEGNSNVIMTYQVASNTNTNTHHNVTSYLLSEFQHMNRPYDELVVKSIRRLALNCQTKLKKKIKKEKKKEKKKTYEIDEYCTSGKVIIKYEDHICNNVNEMRNYDLKSDMLIYVDSLCFKVIKNSPNITSLSTYPKLIITYGCMIIPLVECEFANDFQCVWLCEKYPKSNDYIIISKDKSYTPVSATYIGCRIKLICNPIYHGDTKSIEGKHVVYYLSGTLQPMIPILNKMLQVRHDYNHLKRVNNEEGFIRDVEKITLQSSNRSCKELRVVSYNILAEPYATSTQAIKTLFRYCDAAYLQTEYRVQRVLLELLSCDADIICLQECDRKVFQTYLLPTLGGKGYSGHFTSKTGFEGCAIFTYNFTCKVMKYIDLPLKNVLRTAPYLETLYTQRPDLRDVIGGKLGTICQLAVIQSVKYPSKQILVANTHLFYHPSAGGIRLFQLYAITKAIEKLKNNLQSKMPFNELYIDGEESIESVYLELEYNIQTSLKEYSTKGVINHNDNVNIDDICTKNNKISKVDDNGDDNDIIRKKPQQHCNDEMSLEPDVSVVLLGDFNSTPETAAIEFLTKGFVSSEKWISEWNRLQEFYWGESTTSTTNSTDIIDNTEKTFTSFNTSSNRNDSIDNLYSTNLSINNHNSHINMNKNNSKNNNIMEIQNLNHILTHSLNLLNASGYPKYSNYTAEFKELLDYIWISNTPNSFKVIRVAPFPEEDILSENVALPSKVFPSDHLSIMIDIEFI